MGVFAERINSMPKYVASRSLHKQLDWNATLLEGDLAESVPALKERPGSWSSPAANWPTPSPPRAGR